MRRILSVQASQALFGTVPRTLTVMGMWLVCILAAAWFGPFIPWWWVVPLVSLLLYAFTIYLGSVWLDRDILRESRQHHEDDEG